MNKLITITVLIAPLLIPMSAVGADKTPGEAYLEYHAVLKQSFDDEAIWPYHVRAARAQFHDQFPPEIRGRAFFIMKSAAPGSVRVDKVTITGDTASLVLIPTAPSQADRGDATMRLEDGAWKVEKVVWRVP